jgi:hypothetical protein
MALERLEVRVSLEKLLVVLMVILIPLNFLGLYLATRSHTAAEHTTGALFSSIAQNNALIARQFIEDRVIDVAGVAAEAAIVDAIAAANRSSARMTDDARAAQIADVEEKWNTPEADALASSILTAPASVALRHHRERDPRFLKLIVMNGSGVPVAATDKPAHYAPADEVFWQAVSANGRGNVYVSDVAYDEKTKANYVVVGFPVLDQASQRFVGAVCALVDISPLFAWLNREGLGRGAGAMLIRDDGTVVTASNVTTLMRMKPEEYRAVRDALGTIQGRQVGYVIANMHDGMRIVGFSDTGLKPSYPNLGWYVLVSQNEDEALSPVRTVGYFAFFMVVVGLLMVTLLAAYFFMHRKQELADIEARSGNSDVTKEHGHDLVAH